MPSGATTIAVRSFAKINLGLYIGARRLDGFHDLRTVYQTIALHDVVRVSVQTRGVRSTTIEITCNDPRVPPDSSNTCYRISERFMEAVGVRGCVRIEVEKKLPVQGGLGGASSNAVATMFALEQALRKQGALEKPSGPQQALRIAAEVGSDLPLFVLGGTVLGVGRGEEVYPLPDLPSLSMVVITPRIGISTPRAFADWDALMAQELTHSEGSDRLVEVGRALSAWLTDASEAGAPAKGGGRAGSLLSDLVRAGVRNDFEQVVFSQSPELRDMKRALERAGSRYVSLSGSGSTLYGLFHSRANAVKAAKQLRVMALDVEATNTLTRHQYWSKLSLSR